MIMDAIYAPSFAYLIYFQNMKPVVPQFVLLYDVLNEYTYMY